jgi:class 3 adenylate cyclase
MAEKLMAEQRKLAAILAADVVGFSRLTGADEERTLARLRALRSDLIDPTIAAHRGRVVKRAGDGAIVEFRSVVDAVRCAIDVQSAMVQRNVGLPPERRIDFRVGIHVGDVVEESDGDLMGDGVNIAARIETIADAAGIALSVDVREAARQLGTRYVLEGSVRKSGQRLRVTAQLIDAKDGTHLWADRYDRTIEDIFAIQDEITLALATEIHLPLSVLIFSPRAADNPMITPDSSC